jgi:DNA-binding MarR family transcriptional regulator
MNRTVKRNHKNQNRQAWCWLEKNKLRLLEDVYSENTGLGSLASARLIYLALAEIASDNERDDNFQVSQAAIAQRASRSVSTVQRTLKVFKQLGLVKTRRNSINGIETRSTYTLVRGALGNHDIALRQTSKIKRHTSEESFEESFEGTARKKTKGVSNTWDSSLAAGNRNGEVEYERKW